MTTVRDIMAWLDAFAPRSLAAEWDNTGLLLGDATSSVTKMMTCLTITSEVVREAVEENANLIVAHHPVLLKGAKKLSSETVDGRLLLPLLKSGIAVYSPHTSFDNCPGGINDSLAERLALTNVSPLRPREMVRECKLVVFVPESDLTNVSEALFANGAGRIGQYEQCSYRIPGTGTFFGTEGANPAVGIKGRLEQVSEWRLEVIVPENQLDVAVRAMKIVHSYEEPAYDVYPLKTIPRGGEGRIGDAAVTLGQLAKLAGTQLAANAVQIVGDPNRKVKRVAIACGAAGEFLNDALRAGADAFVTGEVRFHDCLAAEAAGIALILPGHYATERPAVEALALRMHHDFPHISIWPSRRETDPLQLV